MCLISKLDALFHYCSSSPFLSSSCIDPGPAIFEVVHRVHDDPTHTDQQMTDLQNEEGRVYGLTLSQAGKEKNRG